MSNVEEILRSEYSQKFDEIRKASMVQSFFKYGPARKNYVNGNCNALASMENCVKPHMTKVTCFHTRFSEVWTH